jgi:hypothetical protein
MSSVSTKFLFQLADATDVFDNDKFLKGNWQQIEQLIYSKTEVDGLISSGSNSNGSYVKYPDGTMICWNSISAVAGTGIQNTGVKTYPITFTAAPFTMVQHYSQASVFANWYVYNNAINGFTLYHQGLSGVDLTGTSFKYIAIGKWK